MPKTLVAEPAVHASLAELHDDLVAHPLYHSLRTVEDVRVFMEHHVFAVWDFMSLLKALQRELTCVDVPWTPEGPNDARRFVNEIVLGEESDEDGRGGYRSHFELYLEAMEECGADTRPIHRFLEVLRGGATAETALEEAGAPASVRPFVEYTLRVAGSGETHRMAAAFFFGREDVIPGMFRELVEDLRREFPVLERLIYYLDRHIEVDGDDHGPRARQILASLCGGDPVREGEAHETARTSLRARSELWDAVLAQITRGHRGRLRPGTYSVPRPI